MKEKPILFEACVETLRECILAEKRGAHRLELCADLQHDGLSPSPELIRSVQGSVRIPIKVMVRPRPGNFVYTSSEIDQMVREIDQLKEMGIPEIVLGLLTTDGNVDIENTAFLAAVAYPLPITFHKAIDRVADPLQELARLQGIDNIKSILSSGCAATALEGQLILRQMIREYGRRFTIIPAGKITNKNIQKVHQQIGAREYHGRQIVGALNQA